MSSLLRTFPAARMSDEKAVLLRRRGASRVITPLCETAAERGALGWAGSLETT